MSTFGKLGVGGKVPGKYPAPSDEQVVDHNAACTGTEQRTPDSRPEVTPESFGAPEHNPA